MKPVIFFTNDREKLQSVLELLIWKEINFKILNKREMEDIEDAGILKRVESGQRSVIAKKNRELKRTGINAKTSSKKKCKYHIIAAAYLPKRKIALTFHDGTYKIINFNTFLAEDGNPMNTQFRPLKAFRMFFIDQGNLCWPGHEMEFEGEYLYRLRGKLI